MDISYTALKHVIWRFRICDYFRKIFKFRDFMDALMISQNQIIVHKFLFSGQCQNSSGKNYISLFHALFLVLETRERRK